MMTINIVKQRLLEQLPDEIDYLMVCASFEDRCLSFYEYLDSERVSKTGVFYFKQFLSNSSQNVSKLEKKFDGQRFEMDYTSPTSIADAIMRFVENAETDGATPNVVIDISTFTRESLLILVRYLLINNEEYSGIYLFYRFASVSQYLSDGVESIRSVLGYMGDVSVDKPTHLVLLSGFEYERAKDIIDALEPDFISIGYGGESCSITTSLYELNKEFTDKLVAYYTNENIHIFEHSLIDPDEVKDIVLKLVDDKQEYNTVVAPLNNKISTLGVALAAVQNASIQLIYSQMEEYNEKNYSQCEDDCLIFNLNDMIIM
ncbi:MAG: hypothetical protein JMN24_15820 [gamma proteobacterium endosymbiont of Lamellibrachia anaximandri]|nr:hypothetical protein [gamma proteobacterium endosymbiont of Lamellibrachia anaximandri]MBL3619043.1 hypothetical protein [gamma proteobacterium endosymbiont of Lamellibrachia anaximandri]